MDDQRFDRMSRGRSGVPAELHAALRLPWVAGSGDEKFDVHLGEQKSPIFLLGSASDAAKFFASSSDATKLLAMQGRHKAKVTQARARKRELDALASKQSARMAELDVVPGLARRMEAAEAAYGSIVASSDAISRLESAIGAIHAARTLAGELGDLARALAPLDAPPVLDDTQLLAHVTTQVALADEECAAADAQAKAAAPLLDPPEQQPATQLAKHIDDLAASSAAAQLRAAEAGALDEVASPPPLEDAQRLVADIRATRVALVQVATCEVEGRALDEIAGPPELADTVTLSRDVAGLTAAHAATTTASARHALLGALLETPATDDTRAVTEMLAELRDATAAAAANERDLGEAKAEGRDVADAIRRWAEDSVTCPTCGAALDAEAVAQHVAGAHEERGRG